jgi:hypothetical protein
MAGFEGALITAPDRLARTDVHHMRLIDARDWRRRARHPRLASLYGHRLSREDPSSASPCPPFCRVSSRGRAPLAASAARGVACHAWASQHSSGELRGGLRPLGAHDPHGPPQSSCARLLTPGRGQVWPVSMVGHGTHAPTWLSLRWLAGPARGLAGGSRRPLPP